jgi:hypothetical protein
MMPRWGAKKMHEDYKRVLRATYRGDLGSSEGFERITALGVRQKFGVAGEMALYLCGVLAVVASMVVPFVSSGGLQAFGWGLVWILAVGGYWSAWAESRNVQFVAGELLPALLKRIEVLENADRQRQAGASVASTLP